jgi:hypothetical protein
MDHKLKEYTSDFPSHYMSVIHSTLTSSKDTGGSGGHQSIRSAEYKPFKLQNSKTASYMKARNRINATIAKNTLVSE